MEENSKQSPLKMDKKLNKKEEKRQNLFSNNKREITQEEYNYRTKNCFFFMRSPLSRQIVLEIKDDSKKKKKKKKKQVNYFYLQFKSESKNNSVILKHKTQNKEGKNSYINLQPRKTWFKCKNIYNKCLKNYNPEEVPLESRFQKYFTRKSLYENTNNIALKSNIDVFPLLDKPKINYYKRGVRTKTLRDNNMAKNKLLFQSINLKLKYKSNQENNFVKWMNRTINLNFVNKGINDILNNRNLEDIGSLKELKFGKDTKKKENKKKLKIKLSYRFERKRLSLINAELPKLATAKRMGISLDFHYKINSFFYLGEKDKKINEDEEQNDLEIVSEKGNLVIKESNHEKANLENYIENQSELNYFFLKNIFRLDLFHIIGLISGKGEDAKKCSRLLKKILIDKFSNEINYINSDILEKNQFKQKIDYILFILTKDDFEFIKNIFNSLEKELIKMGIDVEKTGATFSLIIFIKDKVISLKIGDIHPYFVYNVSDLNTNNNLMIRNPHYGHNISNILEQDRLEENKCEIKIISNKIGVKNYKIEYKYDKEIQDLLEKDNINYTRVLGYNKIKKTGIIDKPEILMFSMDVSKYQKEFFGFKRKNKNPHVSDSDFYSLIKKKGIIFTDAILKFVIVGNDELFDIMKKSYYIKEINEAMNKDEIENNNKDNIKYCFNMKRIVKKLVNNSIDINNIFTNQNTFKDSGLALVTLVET